MKVIKGIFFVLIGLTALAAAGGYLYLYSGKPQYQGTLFLEGLQDEVKIYFDNFGIPHIYAANEEDAYFALGYVHAQDRLFQMELLRRVGAGRLAEIFGPALAKTDQFLRTVGINEIAELSAATFLSGKHEPYQKAAHSYLDGINTFIHHGKTPPEFTLLGIPKEDFTPVDIYRVVGYMGFNFNTAVRTDPLMTVISGKLGSEYLKDLVLHTVKENTTIPTYSGDSVPGSEIISLVSGVLESLPVAHWTGSNSWVVGPDKTQSGYPILANDAHIGFSQPAVWYEAHLNSPGFNFYGNHLAGVPFGLVGHNDFSAWGLTIFPNDDMDFFREKADPGDPGQVWFRDHWEPLQTRKETIRIKGVEDLEFDVSMSRHGPIINEVMATVDSLELQPVSFFWTYLKFPSKALQTAYGMAHSRSMEEFRKSISLMEAPGLNITYADRDGNIAWWTVARLLKRPDHVEPKMILDGASGLDDPLGWYPFAANPRSENPPGGFVYSANNQPDSAWGIFHQGYYYPGLRAQRITELLAQRADWDLESFKDMIMDDISPAFPETSRQILSLLDGNIIEHQEQVAEALAAWKGSHGLKDIGPTIYYHLANRIQQNTFLDELGEENYQVYSTTLIASRTFPFLLKNDSSIWWDDIKTAVVETRTEIIKRSFAETVEQLSDQFGNDPKQWHWEKVHTLEHMHALGRQKPFNYLFNVGPFPVTGGDEVINKMDFYKYSTPYQVRSGPSMRMLIDLANPENSLSIIPTGQSGHVMSPHYRDQAALYNSGEFRPQHMNRQKIESLAEEVLILRPMDD